MPPEQFQQLMGMMNSGGGGGGGMGGMGGMPPGAGAGGNVIRLSEEEGAAVGRLTELGFDRTDAAQVRSLLVVRVSVFHVHSPHLLSPFGFVRSRTSYARCQVEALKVTRLLCAVMTSFFILTCAS